MVTSVGLCQCPMPNGETLLSVGISTLIVPGFEEGNPYVAYIATNRHSSSLFENHVAKPSWLGSSLRCLIGIIR